MLVMTILAFGAVTIGAGLALGTWIQRRTWAVAVSIGLFLPVAVAWPLLGTGHLFVQLVTREPQLQLQGLGGRAVLTISIVANILLVIILLWLTIRTLERRFRHQHQARVFTAPPNRPSRMHRLVRPVQWFSPISTPDHLRGR